MQAALLVFLGGGMGSLLRFGSYHLARLWLPASFPWGTFAVNVGGGLAIGCVAAALAGRPAGASDPLALFLMTGVLGGFTTFSAFGLETLLLWQRSEQLMAAAYVAGSVGASIGATLAGFSLVRALS